MKLLLILFVCLHMASLYSKVKTDSIKNALCQLNESDTLKIGCTNNCGRFNEWALKWYARKLNYSIEIIDLRLQKPRIHYTEVDGILIPGGVDINPNRYITLVHKSFQKYLQGLKSYANITAVGKKRDSFEFDLISRYFKNPAQRDQPILGICRGMQVLSVSQGIPLYVDIKKELGIENRIYTLDEVTISKPTSLIAKLVGAEKFTAFELHHQGLNLDYFNQNIERWPHLEITSLSNENKIVETLEFKNRPILGVQFHPEFMLNNARSNIFKWFLQKSCLNKTLNQEKLKDIK